MASVKSVAITNLDAVPAVNSDGGNLSPMMVWHDTYEASSLASGSDITIARIPAGATIHDVIVKADALGGSSTLTVGDSGDADRYLAAVGTWNAAGQCQSMLAGSTAANTAVAGLGYKVSEATDLKITTGGATISGTIYFWVYYTQ
ncbi:MAG: hypothetical protein Unbinned2350contig1001_10 [Prokaryotic dsDNA virus sp.]|jgi:hypothetical protein|nr:MAG: hypothetical protein Unbinned2350contig1001_10 [Prokaryotic dsDNA virus sp.]|tara:strand:- start:14775 stop:15212 length:438 start_codon:yes stop_codon:yes gene_type:complete